MGGSPSTGSSVLVNILNRHSKLCAGPETYVFMHPKLYRDWATYAPALQRRRLLNHLCSEGWFVLHGTILAHSFYQWTPAELSALAKKSKTLTAFATAYFGKVRKAQGAQRWVEKSPSNVVAFPHFLDAFPQGQVIHTVRNPFDTMASLHRRGLSAYYAAGAYLTNNALALRCKDHTRYFRVDYEALVEQPRESLNPLLRFLDLDWEDTLLETEKQEVRMEGWKNQEHG
ncbi:MAG: sulfotransferase, partial [Bacteroidota bacterium]